MRPEPGDAHWLKVLSRWSLIVALTYIALFSLAPIVFSATNPLGAGFAELSQAIQHPVAFRIAMILDSVIWVLLAGFFLIFAAIARKRTPVLAAFLLLCAVGHLFGSLGGYFRLTGTYDIATRYAAAAPDQQALILESYRGLHILTTRLQDFGGLFTKAGLLLAAWIGFSLAGFPRWVAIGFVVQALIGVLISGLNLAGAEDTPLYLALGAPYILIWIVWGFALAVYFWRPRLQAE